MKISPIERFLSKVEKTKSCWLWKGTIGTSGYGVFNVGSSRIGAHRFSYLYHIENIPMSMSVCHKCDNPICVNPKHLFIGTQKDNLYDMHSKGRQRKKETYTSGEDHFNAKLSNQEVLEIRKLYKPKLYSTYKLSKQFKVSRRTIGRILKIRNYKNV